jgi:hypothetical protein
MVPGPLKLRLMVVPERPPEPAMLGNDPVAPAYAPAPPVTVATAVPDPPLRNAAGIVTVPVRESVPDSLTVKGPVRPAVPAVSVAENCPLPMPFVKSAVPVAVTTLPLTVAFTDNVVLMVAACAATQTSRAKLTLANWETAEPIDRSVVTSHSSSFKNAVHTDSGPL